MDGLKAGIYHLCFSEKIAIFASTMHIEPMEKFNKKDIARLRQLIDEASSVVITAHVSPDGDAVGSALGLSTALSAMGKDVKVIVPSTPALQLKFLPGFRYIDVYKNNADFDDRMLAQADLIFCLDFNALNRVEAMAPALAAAKAPKVMIDHHLDPEPFCDVTISRPKSSSTCLLLFKVLCALELADAIDRDCATCLMAGMMTDTGNFTFNSNDPDIYEAMAELVRRGANRDRLSKLLFDTFTENCLRLNAYALYEKMSVWPDKGVALIWLTSQEMKRFHSRVGDTEGLVNKPLAIEQVRLSCFLRQEENYIKVSMRSKGDVRCDAICAAHFGGGGHRNAAGGEYTGTMEQAKALFESLIDEIHDNYIQQDRK